LLIVRDLIAGPRRFVELQRVLPGISTEQLRSRLNRMVADGMLTRKRYREVPPRVDYELTERARDLEPILGQLARWGYEWVWSAPRPNELVDLGAIFRLAPGLLSPSRTFRGTVELTLTDRKKGGGAASYSVIASRDGVAIEERPAIDAHARIVGPESAWVRAFSPDGDREGLVISGDAKLAAELLDGLALSAPRVAATAAA
jgi:DNA-binding HxlR family transcriptional regulator